MNQLIVVAFDHLEDARTAMKRLARLEARGPDLLRGHRDHRAPPGRDGQSEERGERTTETGAVLGALVGAVVTFAFPLVGAPLERQPARP